MNKSIKLGVTLVNVFRREADERSGKETVRKIHSGVVIQEGNKFLRVFNPAPQDRGGDVSAQASQWYPISSPRAWIELTGELKEPLSFPAGI